jgi:signal transduction histidine kinase
MHRVHFFDHEVHLVDPIWDFVAPALQEGGAVLVVARPSLRQILAERARECLSAEAAQRLEMLDAQGQLDRFMVEGWPDAGKFLALIGGLLDTAARRCAGPLHVYGEMVALLCEQGHHEAALRLEALWNELAASRNFSLLCAYPWRLFQGAGHAEVFDRVCRLHGSVRAQYREPTDDELDLPRRLAYLEQKARSLEFETERRERAECDRAVALAAAGQATSEFRAMLGHELRNPLSPIVNALELMRLRGLAATEREIIERQVDRLLRVVDRLTGSHGAAQASDASDDFASDAGAA